MSHLPLEISQSTKFLQDRGATIMMQGDLEILCAVKAKLIGTKKNKEILAQYLEMVQTHYS